MNHSEDLQREIENLRERLSRLSRASRLVAGGLDLDTAGQVAARSASGLTPGGFR